MNNVMISHPILKSGYSPAFMWTRLAVICLIAVGHISTLPLGPHAKEVLYLFGYNPSWLGVNTLFLLAGFMAMRSLTQHKSAWGLITSRLTRNLPTVVIYTVITLFILFPIFGIKPLNINSLPKHLALYAFDVISCVDPGRKLQGLLDNAQYECVIQGAIWTFRWGAIAYIGAAIGWKTGLLKSKIFTSYSAILATLIYICFHGITIWRGVELPESITIGLRFAWLFIAGMSAFQNFESIPRRKALVVALFIFTFIQYTYLPWTPILEISASLLWGYIAFLFMTSRVNLPAFMKKSPDLALGIYVFHWPIAQIVLLLRPETTPFTLFLMAMPIVILIALAINHTLNIFKNHQKNHISLKSGQTSQAKT